MSTNSRLQELLQAGELHEWSSPLLPVKAKLRRFLVTSDIRAALDADPWPASIFESKAKAAERRVSTHTFINAFIEGQNMTVGVGKDDADLKCLSPMQRVPSWRVVEMRPEHGKRWTRVLGEFAEENVFVALMLIARDRVRNWDKVAGSVDAEWMKLFPGEQPVIFPSAPAAKDFGKSFSDV